MDGFYGAQKPLTAAQRKRLKKKQQQYELDAEIQREKDTTPDESLIEHQAIAAAASSHGLKIFKILGDGNCLFRALDHQLRHVADTTGDDTIPRHSYDILRALTVQHLSQNKNEYQHFVHGSSDNVDDVFDAYCKRMLADGEWGGDIEIKVMTEVLGCRIRVFTEQLQPIIHESHLPRFTLNISFHRRAFAVGGHYNSLVKAECQ